MLRGYLREPLTFVVEGVRLIQGLRRRDVRVYDSVEQALNDFTSGAGKPVPTSQYEAQKEVKPKLIRHSQREQLRLLTAREI
jgi:hypothetical protein